jgi:hypothetical protein
VSFDEVGLMVTHTLAPTNAVPGCFKFVLPVVRVTRPTRLANAAPDRSCKRASGFEYGECPYSTVLQFFKRISNALCNITYHCARCFRRVRPPFASIKSWHIHVKINDVNNINN